MSRVTFSVNGVKCTVPDSIPRNTSLNAFIRYALELPGTKAMCREGGCGACAVTVRARRYPSNTIETFTVNSCLVLVLSCHGWDVTTIEGLGNRLQGYHDIQKRIAAFNGTQCGYCTPGWVMHMNSLQDKGLTMEQLEKSFASNTCRCTGFRPILDTIKSFAVDASPELCQRVKDIEDLTICEKTTELYRRKCSTRSDGSDWSIIEDIQFSETRFNQILHTDAKTGEIFLKVYTVKDIFGAFSTYGTDSYMLIDGNTSKGVSGSFEYPRILIDISEVNSLKSYVFDQNLILGANISLEDCIKIFTETAKSRNDEFAYLADFSKHFELIAHLLVRKIGSLAGNLMTKHSIPTFQSDVFLLLTAIGAMVTVCKDADQKITLSMTDFLNFNMHGNLIVNIELPPLSKQHIFRSYKIMPRNQNALAIVNAAFLVKLNETSKVLEEVNLVYGNISPSFIHATNTEKYLLHKNVFNNGTLQAAVNILSKEITPQDLPPEPSPDCRKKLAIGLFYKFILNITSTSVSKPRIRSGGTMLTRPVSSGSQKFESDPLLYPLTKPVPKYEATIQSSGEAEYANDIPNFSKQVFAAFVLSTIHVGEIDIIDSNDALKIDGVLAIYMAGDIPGKNSFITHDKNMMLIEDEEILVANKVKYYGQPIAIVVAISEELAERAAKKVKVTYKNVSTDPPVLYIDQAKIDSKRYVVNDGSITPKGRGVDVTKVIRGVFGSPLQYAYFMEPMTCVAVPKDNGMEIYDSTHWPYLTQCAISQSLGINQSLVLVKVRRIGGAFGGKITRSTQVAAACALVAHKMDRPCRFIVPIQTCMSFTGKRMSNQFDYEIGVNDEGKIQYIDVTSILNKGFALNDNYYLLMVMNFANCYDSSFINLKSASVRTDTPGNSFVRAPGSTEAIACIETIMEHIAVVLQKDPIDVRLTNMLVDDENMPTLVKEFIKDVEYDKRAEEIEHFNQANRWMKKAIKISIMQFAISYVGNYSAMVSIYKDDGSVSVTIGGIEMGQGINTKAAQVCAYELGIPLESVSVLPSYSFVSANNICTAASVTSESVCYAIIKACEIIKSRLEPLKLKMNTPTWKELIQYAGKEQIDLTAKYMMQPTKDDLSSYNIFGIAALEVQLDILTGRFQILRVDILEDVGRSISPNIDIGQVEGAFVQGLGYFTCEKLVFDDNTGKLLTNRSLSYHVPLALDIPVDFRVKLRYNAKNPKGVLGSKAVGEMGMCTANVITLALRHCIMESRKDSGYDTTEWINIDIPYDTESILKALNVKLHEMVLA